MSAEEAARQAVVACARELQRLGLNHGTSGNVGLRLGNGVLVTPTGIAPEKMTAADVVLLDHTGVPAPGQRAPTSEWRIHLAVLTSRRDVSAVVHTHSPEATAAACLRRPLPAVHYVVARGGGPTVPCAEYATYGTPELSANVVAALGGQAACLMANHGLLTVGADLDAARSLAVDVEWLARVVRLTGLQTDSRAASAVHVLSDDEIARVAERLRSYGQAGGSEG